MNRVFEVWYGAQASGKTYQLRRRAAVLAARPSIRRVIVLAPPGEWKDIAEAVPLSELDGELWRNDAPRVPVLPTGFQLGDLAALEQVADLAARWGDCAIVLDETAFWVPATHSTETMRKTMPRFLDIVVRGRHLERMDGVDRPTHLVIASQYARTVHHLVNEQAYTIMVAKPDGGLSAKWIAEFSSNAMRQRAEELGEHQWLAIRGRDPRRG